jgi:WD40 repeat protein
VIHGFITSVSTARFDLLPFSHDSQLLAGTQNLEDGNVRVWQVEDGKLLLTHASETFSWGYSPDDMAFSPDDAAFALLGHQPIGAFFVSICKFK